MNTRDSTTPNREKLVDGNLQTQWTTINWKETEASINRLQVRIAKAFKEFHFQIFELPDTERV